METRERSCRIGFSAWISRTFPDSVASFAVGSMESTSSSLGIFYDIFYIPFSILFHTTISINHTTTHKEPSLFNHKEPLPPSFPPPPQPDPRPTRLHFQGGSSSSSSASHPPLIRHRHRLRDSSFDHRTVTLREAPPDPAAVDRGNHNQITAIIGGHSLPPGRNA